jgi:Polysaccharide lyase
VLKYTLRTWRKAHGAALLLTLMGSMVIAGTAQASTAAPPLPPGLTFNGTFSTMTPWTSAGGGIQCANHGTPSQSPRLRGTFTQTSNVNGMTNSGQFSLPADSSNSTYPLEACDVVTGSHPIGLGTDDYYGLSVYVPQGWTIPNKAFDGVEIQEYHFQNVYGAPISFQLHADHVTLAVQTGACNNHTTAAPGCVYHSNADNPNGNPGTLPAYYVIPRGALVEGQWNQMLMHVHWASNSTGQIQTWYKTSSSGTWNSSSNITGIPTVQWDTTRACCANNYADESEAYTGALSAPLSLWLGQDLTGSSFNATANAMSLAPPTPAGGSTPASKKTVKHSRNAVARSASLKRRREHRGFEQRKHAQHAKHARRHHDKRKTDAAGRKVTV